MTQQERAAQLLAAVQHPEGVGDRSSVAERLLVLGCAGLPVSGAGLSWATAKGATGVVAATDALARLVEDLQFSLGEGPCVDSSTTGRPALHPDLARSAPARWPAFGLQAAGIAAVFAFPLQVGAIHVGALDLYRDTPGWLAERDVDEALALAAAATSVLLHLRVPTRDDQHGLGPGPADPVLGRAEVHQATGMVAVQAAVPLVDALSLLRARAFATDRSVVDVARDVVRRVVRFEQ